jgi:hypothetical protein
MISEPIDLKDQINIIKFKLLSIMIVLVVSYMSSIVYARQSEVITCMNDIRSLSLSIEFFKEEEGQYPPESSWDKLLIGINIDNLNTSKFEYHYGHLTDPWGNKYIYRYPAVVGSKPFDLYSFGKDGISKSGGNDSDDINNWNSEAPWLYEAYGFITERTAKIISVGILLLGILILATLSFFGYRIVRYVKK